MSEEVKEWILAFNTNYGVYEGRQSQQGDGQAEAFLTGDDSAVVSFRSMEDDGSPGAWHYMRKKDILSIQRIPVEQEEERVSQP